VTGPAHYLAVQALLDHAAGLLRMGVADQERAEVVARQAAIAMPAPLDRTEVAQWREVTAPPAIG
jgi:hypothetical protein